MKKTFSLLVIGMLLSFGCLAFADTLDDALLWMQKHTITSATTKDAYKADTTVTRQAASKFLVQFAKTMKKKMTNYLYSNRQCAFTDVGKNNSLRSDIQLACKLGYLLGKDKKFTPGGTFTIAQAVVTTMRIMEGKKKENVSPWYKNYFDAANKKGYLKNIDVTDPSKPITRGSLSILLYTIANPKAGTGTVVVSSGATNTGATLPQVTTPTPGTGDANTGSVNSGAVAGSGTTVDSGSVLSGGVVGSGTDFSGSVVGTGASATSGAASSGIVLQ